MFCAILAVISILGAALEAGSLPEGSSVSNDRLCTARCFLAVEADISTLADSPWTVVELQCDPALPAVGADISPGVATAVGADLSSVVLSAELKTSVPQVVEDGCDNSVCPLPQSAVGIVVLSPHPGLPKVTEASVVLLEGHCRSAWAAVLLCSSLIQGYEEQAVSWSTSIPVNYDDLLLSL
jgi:hypothetical protein